jgi:hypothetical protein
MPDFHLCIAVVIDLATVAGVAARIARHATASLCGLSAEIYCTCIVVLRYQLGAIHTRVFTLTVTFHTFAKLPPSVVSLSLQFQSRLVWSLSIVIIRIFGPFAI